jgi:lysozyme family protein
MTDIDKLIDGLIDREGGYTNNPNDSGGETNFGITLSVARANGYFGSMADMPRSTAASIYRRLYWEKPSFDLVAATYPRVAAELFDTGVNMGPKVATTFLQRALNALNRNGADYVDIKPDGEIGGSTASALGGFRRVRGLAGEQVLLAALNALQGCRYISLAEAHPKDESFLYGWLANRVAVPV